MKSIGYYCSHYFDARTAISLSAPEFLRAKINAAKLTKFDVDIAQPFDSIRSNNIASAIEDWQGQLQEIYGHKEPDMKYTTLQAWFDGVNDGTFKTQAAQVYKVLLDKGPQTRLEISDELKIPINAVCGRIADLITAGKVIETGMVTQRTGKSAYQVKALIP